MTELAGLHPTLAHHLVGSEEARVSMGLYISQPNPGKPNSSQPAEQPTSSQVSAGCIAQRLQAATTELNDLEKLVVRGDFSPRVLSDFRSAVDNIRCTAWTVQQWIGLQQQSRDPYSVLRALSVERVRRATQIARDLALDLQGLEIDFDTEGLTDLYDATEELRRCLAPLFKKDA